MKVTFLDTETSGLLKPDAVHTDEQPYIIEFYGVQYNILDDVYEKVAEFETFISVPVPLSAEITRITGIDDSTIQGKPSFAEVYEDMAEVFLGSRRMVGHNLPFDTGMLGNELIRIDRLIHFPWPIEHVCTVEASLSVEGYRLNLGKAYEMATGGTFERHRAKNDVQATVEVYKWLVKKKLIR